MRGDCWRCSGARCCYGALQDTRFTRAIYKTPTTRPMAPPKIFDNPQIMGVLEICTR